MIALLLVCIFFTTQSDRFLSGQNFSLIFQATFSATRAATYSWSLDE